MHRHGYKGRKFGRERDQRRALLKSLAESLIIHESIETTLPKAKEIIPYVEKLITKAKKGDLHNRRQIISSLQTETSAQKLVDVIAPRFTDRSSGHLTIARTSLRRGDNTQLARVAFVTVASKPVSKSVSAANDKPAAKSSAKKVTTKKPAKATKSEEKK